MRIIGEKLKQARIIRGLSITELAERLEVTKQAISQYESEEIDPKNETVYKFVWKLCFPLEFFTRDYVTQIESTNKFFRALSSTNQLDKRTQEEKTIMVIRIYNFLNEFLDLPVLRVPDIRRPDKEIEDYQIEDYDYIAMQVRSAWNLGDAPIKNLITVLEQNGIVVSTIKNAKREIDAYTQVHTVSGDGMQYCIVIEDGKNSMSRRNFSAAHELGHIILHSELNIDEMEKDQINDLEKQANAFASAFLMPRQSFYNELREPTNINRYLPLKKKWHVSIMAMIMRSRDLMRINQYQYSNLMRECGRRKFKTEGEPLDKEIPIQQPQLFKQALELLLKNNVLTVHTLLKELEIRGMALRLNDIIDLLALTDDFFAPYQQEAPKGFTIRLKTESDE